VFIAGMLWEKNQVVDFSMERDELRSCVSHSFSLETWLYENWKENLNIWLWINLSNSTVMFYFHVFCILIISYLSVNKT
jgi:hypothetical protein